MFYFAAVIKKIIQGIACVLGFIQLKTHPHWSNELMFQMQPCTKILCSYIAIKFPSVYGVSFWNTMELVGRFPKNTFNYLRVNNSFTTKQTLSKSAVLYAGVFCQFDPAPCRIASTRLKLAHQFFPASELQFEPRSLPTKSVLYNW